MSNNDLCVPNPINTELCFPNIPYQLDIAVICEKMPKLILRSGQEHIIDLDPVDIDESLFKSIFYKCDSFSITPLTTLPSCVKPLLSFTQRTVFNEPFSLIKTIIKYIESDLSITKDMISTCSFINLNKLINSIDTLYDINLTNVTCSLNWSDIVKTFKAYLPNTSVTPKSLLSVSVVFASPTEGVKPVVVKFNYLTTITLV
jgi:hypothetical protein